MTTVSKLAPALAAGWERIEAPDSDIRYCADWLDRTAADRLLATVLAEVEWGQHRVRIAGREFPCPRLSAWQGEPGIEYAYSGLRLRSDGWHPALAALRDKLTASTGVWFNSVLANRYRDGADSMGWHADDEPELGRDPIIASVSVGAERRFVLRHRRAVERRAIALAHGSLLLMAGATQHQWRHALPKTKRPSGERVNLTFRSIQPVPS